MKKIIISVSAVLIAIFISFGIFYFQQRKPVVGILFPIDSSTAFSDRMVGVLVAVKSMPGDVNFVDIDYTSSDLSTVVSKAIKSGIRYFVTFLTSTQASQLKSILNNSNVIMIDSQVTNPFIIQNTKNFYTVSPTDTAQALAIANYIHDQNYKSVLIIKGSQNPIYEDYLSSQIQSDLAKMSISSTVISVNDELRSTPDCVTLVMSSTEALKIIPNLRSKYGNVPLVGSDWILDQDLLNSNLSNGIVVTSFANLSNLPQSLKAYLYKVEMFADPSMLLAYNATVVAFILAKDGIDPNEAQKFLNSHTFIGSDGEFTFTSKSVRSHVYFYRISNENLILVSAWRQ